MKKCMLPLGVIFLFLASVCFAQSQTQPQTQTQPESNPNSLAEVAKKEKERREKTKTTKTFTNQDIQDFKEKNKIVDEEKEEGDNTAAEQPEPAASTDLADNEEYWRQKSQAAQERIQSAEQRVNQLQSEINELTRAFYAEGDGVAQRPLIESERGDRLNALDQAKKEVEDAKVAAENLEDEARKAGAPPGWVRE